MVKLNEGRRKKEEGRRKKEQKRRKKDLFIWGLGHQLKMSEERLGRGIEKNSEDKP
jgi:hypothetical protein